MSVLMCLNYSLEEIMLLVHSGDKIDLPLILNPYHNLLNPLHSLMLPVHTTAFILSEKSLTISCSLRLWYGFLEATYQSKFFCLYHLLSLTLEPFFPPLKSKQVERPATQKGKMLIIKSCATKALGLRVF